MEYKLTYDEYAAALKRDKLLGLRCKKCMVLIAPPTMACLECGSADLEVAELSGEGKIDSFTVIRVPPEGFEDDAPYIVVRVKLNEGPLIAGRLKGISPEKASINLIGKKVKVGHIILQKEKFKYSGIEAVAPMFSLKE